MKAYKIRKLGAYTACEAATAARLTAMTYYSARQGQADLDRLTEVGEYTLDGDTYHGYEVVHTKSGRVVVRHFAPRELVILTVVLWQSAADRHLDVNH